MTNDEKERAVRLDDEVKPGGKRFDHVYDTHGKHRIRVTVERLINEPRLHSTGREYRAMASFDGRTRYGYGMLPSHAYAKLSQHLSHVVSRHDYDLNVSNNGPELLAA